MRKLASIRLIDKIDSIPEADSIAVATVGGWQVVIRKDEFKPGDLAVYCEIDSWMPHELAPFLSKNQEPREYNGVKGERLRTVRLRGQISQGLLLSGTQCPTGLMVHRPDSMAHIFQEGDDVSEWLGIQKWEAPVPARLAGDVKGIFPSRIPKTDQERIQNLSEELKLWISDPTTWEITEKLDGSSMTVYLIDGEFGVCSRNYDLKSNGTNSLWNAAIQQNLESIMRSYGANIALQGELIGEGIQGNPYKLKGQQFYLFDIYDIDRSRYFYPSDRQLFARNHGINHVPIVESCFKMSSISSVQDLLLMAEGSARLASHRVEREGLVFKSNQMPEVHFKAISNKFLLKKGD